MRTRIACLALGAGLLTWGCSPAGKSSQQTFDTPEAAVEAMFKAASTNDTTAMLAILGADARDIVIGVDPVQSRRERQVAVAAMIERWWLEGEGDTRTVVIGNESFPMAIPLVQKDGKWHFDSAAGREELMYRRIGQNELTAIEVAEAFVEAQKEYAARSHDGVPKGAYAQRFLSDPGKQNGLYWPASSPGTPQSPMGDLAARAAKEGYGEAVKREPYQGYFFKVLTSQGANAAGGPKLWIRGRAMTGGFAMVAWPADYGASGVMTFVVGPDGVVLQKDLGEETGTLAAGMTAFDPDTSWARP